MSLWQRWEYDPFLQYKSALTRYRERRQALYDWAGPNQADAVRHGWRIEGVVDPFWLHWECGQPLSQYN